jgi:hypothetical protein
VKSRPGRGSVFAVRLPREAPVQVVPTAVQEVSGTV